MLDPLFKIAATVVDKTVTRVSLGLLGIVVTAVFGVFAVTFFSVNPIEEPAAFMLGSSAFLGLIGWWARIFMRSTILARHPKSQAAICVFLIAGIGAAGHTLFMVPANIPAFPLLASMVAAGVLMLLGTVTISQPGV